MSIRIALVSEVYPDRFDALLEDLGAAADAGARIAVLPECPAQGWAPGGSEPSDLDCEPAGGPRDAWQALAAREAGIALLGGGIERCPDGQRRNAAVLWDASGLERLRYHKMHVPDEPGFREAAHYVPGTEPPSVIEIEGLRLGVQICSDNQRPDGAMMLAAQGCDCILNPRATEVGLLDRWKTIWRSNAMVSGCWILSPNRPRPEPGTPLGGPSLAVDPDGEVVVETTDRIAMVDVDAEAVARSRSRYPGYLAIPSATYAAAWATLQDRDPRPIEDP